MKQFTFYILSIGMLSLGAAAVMVPSPAFADMGEACNKYAAGTEPRQRCEAGYGGAICSALTGVNKVACDAGYAQAQKDGKLPAGNGSTGGNATNTQASKCGGAKTEIVSCDEKAGLGALSSIIKTTIMIVTVLIGLVAVGGITYAAILYASASDSQGQVQDAIGIIRNVVIGLILYGFTIAIINWLIPGGVIG